MLAGARPCSGPVVLYMPRAHRSPLAGGVWETLVPGRQSHQTPLPEPALPVCLGPSACPAPFPGLDSEAQGPSGGPCTLLGSPVCLELADAPDGGVCRVGWGARQGPVVLWVCGGKSLLSGEGLLRAPLGKDPPLR